MTQGTLPSSGAMSASLINDVGLGRDAATELGLNSSDARTLAQITADQSRISYGDFRNRSSFIESITWNTTDITSPDQIVNFTLTGKKDSNFSYYMQYPNATTSATRTGTLDANGNITYSAPFFGPGGIFESKQTGTHTLYVIFTGGTGSTKTAPVTFTYGLSNITITAKALQVAYMGVVNSQNMALGLGLSPGSPVISSYREYPLYYISDNPTDGNIWRKGIPLCYYRCSSYKTNSTLVSTVISWFMDTPNDYYHATQNYTGYLTNVPNTTQPKVLVTYNDFKFLGTYTYTSTQIAGDSSLEFRIVNGITVPSGSSTNGIFWKVTNPYSTPAAITGKAKWFLTSHDAGNVRWIFRATSPSMGTTASDVIKVQQSYGINRNQDRAPPIYPLDTFTDTIPANTSYYYYPGITSTYSGDYNYAGPGDWDGLHNMQFSGDGIQVVQPGTGPNLTTMV